MHSCKHCNVIFTQKPSNKFCTYCSTENNIIEIKPKNITISEMKLDYNNQMISYLFPNITIESNRHNNSGVEQITRYVPDNRYTKEFRLGFLHNNMQEFLKLSRSEVENLLIDLYGKHNYKYHSVQYVIIKSNISNDYQLVPMSVGSIVEWFRNNNSSYEGIYYKKTIWALECLNRNDDYMNLRKKLIDSNNYYINALSSDNILI